MSKQDFIFSLKDFVEKKAQSFLQKNQMNEFEQLQKAASKNYPFYSSNNPFQTIGYINDLLNNLVEKVAQNRQVDINTIRDEFNAHYLE